MFPEIQRVTIYRTVRRALLLTYAAMLCAGLSGLQAQTDGTQRWSFDTRGFVQSSPAVDAEGTVYIGVNMNTIPARGRVFAIRRNGLAKWTQLPNGFPTNDYVDAAPALSPDGTTVYFGSWDGVFYARNAKDGSRKWEVTLGGSAPYIASSAAVGQDGIVYFGMGDLLEPQKSALIALTPGGIELWRRTVGSFVDSSPAIAADGSIYFGSWDHYIYALNRDGTEKWSFLTGAEVLSSPAIGFDGTLYVGSLDRRVYALGADGKLAWSFLTDDKVVAAPAMKMSPPVAP